MRRFSAQNNLEPKALLLIDNCAAHNPIESLRTDDGNICAMPLPPNVTALIQPMDQNPIKIVKLKYRNRLLSRVVGNETDSIHDLLKQHALSDAILLLDLAWKDLPESILQNSWFRLLNWDDNQYDEDDDLPLTELFPPDITYQALVNETQQLLSNIAPTCNLTLDDINDWNDYVEHETDDEAETENENESFDGADDEITSIPFDEAIRSANSLIKWCQANQQGAKHMANLLDLRSDIVTKHLKTAQIQKRLTDYFQPRDT